MVTLQEKGPSIALAGEGMDNVCGETLQLVSNYVKAVHGRPVGTFGNVCYGAPMNRYVFLLGREAALGAAEVVATGRFSSIDAAASGGEVLVASTDVALENPQAFLDRIGGTVKLAEVVVEVAGQPSLDDLLALLPSEGKVHFGISWYGGQVPDLEKLGRQLKSALQARDRSARFVSSRSNPLSSVIVRTQKLLGQRGCELDVVQGNGMPTLLCRTLAAQNFIEYGRRDAGRPSRNINRGMLPPKVAQVLLNLAQVKPGDTVLDPFCGTGTVLQEALVMGAGRAIGRDVDDDAVEEATENLSWLPRRAQVTGTWEVYRHDARQVDRKLADGSIDAVVTEPLLGPLRPPRQHEAVLRLVGELQQLYRASFVAAAAALKPGGRLVAVLPVIGEVSSADLGGLPNLSPISLLPQDLAARFGLDIGQRIVYRRPGQAVGRAVVAYEKAGL